MGQSDKVPAKKGGLTTSLMIMFLVLGAAAIVLVSIILKATAIAGG